MTDAFLFMWMSAMLHHPSHDTHLKWCSSSSLIRHPGFVVFSVFGVLFVVFFDMR